MQYGIINALKKHNSALKARSYGILRYANTILPDSYLSPHHSLPQPHPPQPPQTVDMRTFGDRKPHSLLCWRAGVVPVVDRTPFDNNGDWILVDGVVRKLCEFLRKVLTNGVECGIIQEYFVKNTSGKN